MDIKIHDTFFENMCCKKSAKEYEKFILRCGISVKSENAIQIMPDRTADITFKISLSSDQPHPETKERPPPQVTYSRNSGMVRRARYE